MAAFQCDLIPEIHSFISDGHHLWPLPRTHGHPHSSMYLVLQI